MTFPPFLKILLKKPVVCIHQCCSFNNLRTLCKVLILLAAHFKKVYSSLCGSTSWNRAKLQRIFLTFIAPAGIQSLSRFTCPVLSQATCESGQGWWRCPTLWASFTAASRCTCQWPHKNVISVLCTSVNLHKSNWRLLLFSCFLPFLPLISHGIAVSAAILSGWSVMSYGLPI